MTAMPRFRDLPIRQKLTGVNLLTMGFVLLTASAAFVAYEVVVFRERLVRRTHDQHVLGHLVLLRFGERSPFDLLIHWSNGSTPDQQGTLSICPTSVETGRHGRGQPVRWGWSRGTSDL